MRFRTLVVPVVVALLAISLSAASAKTWQKKPTRQKADPISGEWNTSLTAAGSGAGFTLTIKLKLDRDKVTGTYESDHVGSGNIKNGSWAAGKLTLSLETNHGLITLTGELKQSKLTGKFDAGQMQGTWQAEKKKPDVKSGK
jgi:hypothetical protein